MSAVLEAEGLTVWRGDRVVLRELSLKVRAGEWTALVGANGQGKSTLLAALAGLIEPHAGRVALRGRVLADWPRQQRARELAWLAQQADAEGELAALDVVRLGRLPHTGLLGERRATDDAAVDAALQAMDGAALAARRLWQLSGGERQRVLLARVLATGAPLMLLDEPMTHLDAPHQRALVAELHRRCAAGACVLAALHELTQALAADRVVVLADGAVAADGAPGDERLHRAIEAAFEQAVRVVAVESDGPRRWVAVPRR